jgi:predicted RNA-binding protein with PIN domain
MAPVGSTQVLRPALELAVGVARSGLAETPPVPPPAPVRPFLRFAKLSERALATVRDVVDEDGEFRRRVAAKADEAAIGRLPYLWLTRPEGWAEELEAAEAARASAAEEAAAQRAEGTARRRLAAVTEALARSEGDARQARQLVAAAGEELAAARLARRQAEEEARDLAQALQITSGTVTELRDALGEATSARRGLEALVDDAHHRIDELLAERDEARARAAQAEARVLGGRQRADEVRTSLGRAVEEAAGAARLLGEALAAAAGALGQAGDPAGELPPTEEAEAAPPVAGPVGKVGTAPAARRRRPLALPPAVFEDSPEAAAFLTAADGVVIIIDGYNVSLAGWPGEELAAQRLYLVNRLSGLAARRSATVWVVFDGAEQHAMPPPRGSPRDAVRVVFSPAGVDADEVILDMVDDLPDFTPVVVATSDRRVATEAAARGANVISTPQLLGLVGRPLRA